MDPTTIFRGSLGNGLLNNAERRFAEVGYDALGGWRCGAA